MREVKVHSPDYKGVEADEVDKSFISYFLFLISCFLFLICCFLHLVSCFLFLISY